MKEPLGATSKIVDQLVDVAFGGAMRVNRVRYWRHFEAAAQKPAETQRELLKRILHENRDTTFGREHGFSRIDSVDTFRQAVPVQDYESLRSYIEDQERNGTPALTSEKPALYAQTSGTSGSPKYLPITESGIVRVARTQRLFACALHRGTDMFAGKIVGIGSPAIEGYLPGGSPFGSASGMVYEGMPALIRRKYVIGPEVLAIEDHDLRYHLIAMLCLAEPDVSGVATANPSTLLRLRSVMLDDWDELLTGIRTGDIAAIDGLTSAEVASIVPKIPGDAGRADELERLRDAYGDAVHRLPSKGQGCHEHHRREAGREPSPRCSQSGPSGARSGTDVLRDVR